MYLCLKMVKAGGDLLIVGAVMIDFSHATSQVFHLTLHVMNVAKNGQTLCEDGAPGEREAVLGKVSAANVALPVGGSVIQAFDGSQDLQESGFASAIAADESDFVIGRDEPIEVLKQDLGTKTFTGLGELEHLLIRL